MSGTLARGGCPRSESMLARPKIPILSERKVVDAALRVIDVDGLEGLSIRRLADELNVNGASLYHHFPDKDSILLAVAKGVLSRVRAPEVSTDDWKDYFRLATHAYRDALLAHPNVVPLFLERRDRRFGMPVYDRGAALLLRVGVPPDVVLGVMDGLEMLALSSASSSLEGRGMADQFGSVPIELESLTLAVEAASASSNRSRLDFMARALLEGIEQLVAMHQPARSHVRL